jgi:predicted GTPase
MLCRDDPTIEVVAFTATQIPGIDSRRFPSDLAGELYPSGIPIHPEAELEALCARYGVDQVIFAYSDVSHAHVMSLASRALAAGAEFRLPGPRATMLSAAVPVISVCAVRTGCGKSQIARYLSGALSRRGRRVAVIRHPMPYGDLSRQRVQRFASRDDLVAADCTLEEREEYEPHLAAGGVVFAGVDYGAVVSAAEREADIILWDGGNNDFPFVRPDFAITVVDALRPDQLDTHHPGAAVLLMADLIVINKYHAANPEQREQIAAGLDRLVPGKPRVLAASPVTVDEPERLQGARVLVVEDGPTITHGGMPHGAGYRAALAHGAEIVDPRASAEATIREIYDRYDHIGPVLPAVGYSEAQLEALRATIERAAVDLVVAGTPIDLAAALDLEIPVIRARYEYEDAGEPRLLDLVEQFLEHGSDA